jgi:hypothetical protein
MSDSNSTIDQSLPGRISRASFSERLDLLWPLLVIVIGLIFGSLYYVRSSIVAESARQQTLRDLEASIPDQQTISELKKEVASLKEALPPSAFLTSQSCNVISRKTENGEVADTVCKEVPARATVSVNNLNAGLDELSQNAESARASIRHLVVSMRDSVGVAFAEDDSFPTSTDKSVIMYTILVLLVGLTLSCVGCLFWSTNPRVVTYAMDALKMFGGFYVGLLGSIFGLKK